MGKRIAGFGLMICFCMLCMAGGAQAEMQRRTMYFFDTFDTMITIMGYTESADTFDEVTARAWRRFEELHRLYDAYHEYEGIQNIYTLNRDAHVQPVQVAPDLMNLLLFAKAWQPKLQGTVNIAMGSVLQIWHAYRETGIADEANAKVPTMKVLEEANEHTDFDDVILDEENSTVFFSDPALQLDVGSIAKGYAAGLVAQMMQESAMPNFIINAGGNVCTGQPPLDGRKSWGVSLQNPATALSIDAGTQALDTLFVSNVAVVTSGDYQRFYTVDGVRYHHIISPETLMPATENQAVSIVCADSALADMLSTAVFILPYEEGRALVDELEGVEALWVRADGSVQQTEGLAKISKNSGATNE